MRPVFGDTFYFLAIFNTRDQWHSKVVELAAGPTRKIITTEWVLVELADALAARTSRPVFRKLLHEVHVATLTRIVEATSELFTAGLDLYLARDDKDWSLTDCMSFVVMKQHGITEALTADQHFEQAGFTALLKR